MTHSGCVEWTAWRSVQTILFRYLFRLKLGWRPE